MIIKLIINLIIKMGSYLEKCRVETSKLHQFLQNNLPEGLVLEQYQGGQNFRVSGFDINKKGFDKLSIAYPDDATGNRGPKYGDPEVPGTIETALIKDNKLVYIDNLGYDDVCRFISYNELLKELERLKN